MTDFFGLAVARRDASNESDYFRDVFDASLCPQEAPAAVLVPGFARGVSFHRELPQLDEEALELAEEDLGLMYEGRGVGGVGAVFDPHGCAVGGGGVEGAEDSFQGVGGVLDGEEVGAGEAVAQGGELFRGVFLDAEACHFPQDGAVAIEVGEEPGGVEGGAGGERGGGGCGGVGCGAAGEEVGDGSLYLQ